MKFIQFGAGKWGSNHCRILNELGHKVEQVEIERNPLEAILNFKPDAAIITTSSVNHFPLTMLCSRQNLPIFCEKPVCVKEEHLEELAKITVPFMSGHQLLFMPEIKKIKFPYYMLSERTGAIPRDEGAILSLAVHDIAIAHYIFKTDSFDVSAEGNKHNAKIFLTYEEKTAEILVQSFANIRLRHLTIHYGTDEDISTLILSPDNWNRTDLLKLEMQEFIDVVEKERMNNRNNLKFTIDVMKTVFKANKKTIT